jgi:hypothetical protein
MVEVSQVIDEVDQDSALVLSFYGALDWPQDTQTHNQLRLGFYVQQHFNGMQPSAVFIHHHRLLTIMVPPTKIALHGRSQVAITGFKRVVELRQKKLVIADHAPDAQQSVAQGTATTFAMDLWVLCQQLAQQG